MSTCSVRSQSLAIDLIRAILSDLKRAGLHRRWSLYGRSKLQRELGLYLWNGPKGWRGWLVPTTGIVFMVHQVSKQLLKRSAQPVSSHRIWSRSWGRKLTTTKYLIRSFDYLHQWRTRCDSAQPRTGQRWTCITRRWSRVSSSSTRNPFTMPYCGLNCARKSSGSCAKSVPRTLLVSFDVHFWVVSLQ